MPEYPDDKAAQNRPRPWVTRAEAIAVLALVFAFIVWVAVIIIRQRQAGRDLRWTPEKTDNAAFLIDLNRAEAADLMLLPGVGPAKAKRIIEWREKHGPFHALEELHKAAGIARKDLAAMRSLVTLGDANTAAQSDADETEDQGPPPDSAYADPARE